MMDEQKDEREEIMNDEKGKHGKVDEATQGKGGNDVSDVPLQRRHNGEKKPHILATPSSWENWLPRLVSLDAPIGRL